MPTSKSTASHHSLRRARRIATKGYGLPEIIRRQRICNSPAVSRGVQPGESFLAFLAVAAGVLAMTGVVYLLIREPKQPRRASEDEVDDVAKDGDV